jgi:hypothetical protein
MKRILIDHRKLDEDLTALLIATYPDGYGDDDIIAFKNHKGEHIEAVEIRTIDALYLVKISQSLSHFIANYEDTEDLDPEDNLKPVTEEPELELNLESELEEEEMD